MSVPRSSGYFRTRYAQDHALLETRTQRASFIVFALALCAFPFVVGGFALDLANQVLLASIGAVALMLLTGYAGQISLGHAGLLAAGAFTAGILYKEVGAPIWITLPASGAVGALLGVIFGLPSLRLRGLYLAVSTLALHFIVIHVGSEYETKRGFSTGVLIDSPVSDPRAWYFLLLVAAAATVLLSLNLLRTRSGRSTAAKPSRAHSGSVCTGRSSRPSSSPRRLPRSRDAFLPITADSSPRRRSRSSSPSSTSPW
jgi:branched-chain amino acid transport system permease protein